MFNTTDNSMIVYTLMQTNVKSGVFRLNELAVGGDSMHDVSWMTYGDGQQSVSAAGLVRRSPRRLSRA